MTAPEDTFNSSQGSSSTVPEENLPSRATISPPASLSAEFSQETSSAGVDSHEFKKPQTPGRLKRPTLVKRMSSGTMIIPRDQPIEGPEREYPPDDVRSMSPRRSSEITQNLFDNCRESRVSEAMDLQDTLAVLAEKIEDATAGCETLEKNNQALQDAIGDMTRNLSKESFTKKKK